MLKPRLAEIALATGNKGKLAEFNALLASLGIKMYTGSKLVSPVEDGKSYFENAAIKARHAAKEWGVACVGEDSGIEISGLGDLPGIYSSRFSTFSASDIEEGIKRRSLEGFASAEAGAQEFDQKNNELVLKLLRGRTGDERICKYVASIVVASPAGEILYLTETSVWGRILESPKGTNGFGFDSIVEFFDFPGRSVAELTAEEKGLVSHRSQAIRNLVRWLGATHT